MAGIAPKPCLGRCGRLVRGASRCPDCASARERDRTEARRHSEPWRLLYRRPEWSKAAAERRRIDGNACVDCGAHGFARLSVDHEIPLRVIWRETGFERLATFIGRACDVEHLRTRCASCHKLAEDARNA